MGRGARDGTSARRGREAAWRAELARGVRLQRTGDRDGARAAFARAHALAPRQPEPALALGREEHRRGRLVEAERLLRLAREARPAWPQAAAALARVLIERNAQGEAEEILRVALEAEPDSAVLHLVTGELHVAAERPERAEQAFEAARTAGAPDEVIARGLARVENARGMALAGADRLSEAAFAFKRACDLDGRWAPPRVNLGALLHRLGKRSTARAQYRRALELDPRNGIACFNLGLLAREAGDLAAAGRAFADALVADPPHPLARRELALTCAERGELRRAVGLFEEELRATRRPEAGLYANLGLAYARLGERASAEAALRQALVHDPQHAHALTNLAALYAGEGRYLEAAPLLRRARELAGRVAPGNSAAPPLSK